jgi:tetratricopeptide (TPR) repeat protein
MSIDEEVRALQKMVPFQDGEELLMCVEGNVTGPSKDLQNRSGIAFVTTARVGVSAAAGIFEGDAATWLSIPRVLQVAAEPDPDAYLTRIRVGSIDGLELTLQCNDPVEKLQEFADIVQVLCNRAQREDLLQYYQAADQALEANSLEEASNAARTVLKYHPSAVFGHLILWEVYQRSGEWADAANELVEAINSGAHAKNDLIEELAWCYIQLDDDDEAIEATTSVIDSAPTARAYYLRGLARVGKDDLHGALDDLRRAGEHAPGDLDICWTTGSIALEIEDHATVHRCLQAIEQSAEPQKGHGLRAALYCVQHRYADAFAIAKTVVRERPEERLGMRSLLIAGSKLATDEVFEFLPRLDQVWLGNPEYEIYVSNIYLATKRSAQGVARCRNVAKVLGNKIDPIIKLLIACLECSASIEVSAFGSAEREAAKFAAAFDASVLASESDKALWSALCALRGKALVELGRYADALPLLREAEACPDLGIPWLARELPSLLNRAHAGVARSDATSSASVRPPARVSPYQFLGQLAQVLEESGRFEELAARARRDCLRFDEPPLVAVMGEYSVGKSTFINALLRKGLLPTGEGVTTGTITVMQYGEEERMRVVRKDGSVEDLAGLTSVDQFVRETGSDKSVLMIDHVDVFLCADILKRIRIVDTPGLNAPFPEHKQITERYLAESDAILFLFSVEAAGKSGEKQFLDKLQEHRRKAVAVVNQVDLVSAADAKEALDGIGLDFPGTFVTAFGVSAKRALDGYLKGKPDLIAKSGMPSVEQYLEKTLLASARQVKADAAIEKAREILRAVNAARGEFDSGVERLALAIRGQREAMNEWLNDDLRIEIQAAGAELRGAFDAQLRTTAETIASRSSAEALPPLAAMEPLARTLHSTSLAAYRTFFQRVSDAYDRRTHELQEAILGMDWPEWAAVVHGGLVPLRLKVDSWRKDLSDYLEQVAAYMDGFVSARGVGVALLLDLPEGSRNRPDAILAVLRPKMAFMHERAEGQAARWQQELATNVRDELTALERQLREEASRVREHSYRRVEKLGALL